MDSSPDWISRAKRIPKLVVEIGFRTMASFYYGPESGFSPEQWQQLRQPLFRPSCPLCGDLILSQSIESLVHELAEHYRDVLRQASQRGKSQNRIGYHFEVRPILLGPDDLALTFPWYDKLHDALPLFEALRSQQDGLLFHDLEQGWEFHAFASGRCMYLRQGDFDSGEEMAAIVTDRDSLICQIEPAVLRARTIIAQLVEATGVDYWSKRDLHSIPV